MAALGMRILLLLSLSWIIGLTDPLFTVVGQQISGRDLVLLTGGAFLLVKSTTEIHERLEGEEAHTTATVPASFAGVIVQIMLLDIVFSLDSVITAVGMVDDLPVMVAAVVAAVAIMLVSAGPISEFVDRHPTVKMLALSFLLLIGVSLVAEGLDLHIPKGYIYGSMAFAVFVEALNLRVRSLKHEREEPVHLRPYMVKEEPAEQAANSTEQGAAPRILSTRGQATHQAGSRTDVPAGEDSRTSGGDDARTPRAS
jgi:predicted tellurium resistance membrane protein TerC